MYIYSLVASRLVGKVEIMEDKNINILKSIINDDTNMYISFDDIPVFYSDVLKALISDKKDYLGMCITKLYETCGNEYAIDQCKAELEFLSLLVK